MRILPVVIAMLLSGMMLAQQPGTLDPTFNPSDAGFGLGDGTWGGYVHTMARQPDGKVIIGGQFGWHNDHIVGSLSRMNADGTRDETFQIGQIVNGQVFAIALQADGKILLGGVFSLVNGTPRYCLARLNANGSLDTGFDAGVNSLNETVINSIAPRADGTIMIGGWFASIGGVPRNNIARLLANGEVDTSFDPGSGCSGQVFAVRNTGSGRVLVVGEFDSFNGVPRGGIVRVNANGSLDPGFAAGAGASGGSIAALLERADGTLYVGGRLTSFDGLPRQCTARLLANGTVDPTYGGAVGPDLIASTENVKALVEAADGSLLIGGRFTTVGGIAKPYFAKLSNTGVLDPTYPGGTGFSAPVHAMLLRPDGKALVGGEFVYFGDRTAIGYTQLNLDGNLDTSFNPGNGFNGGNVSQLIVQPDQRTLALGGFAGYQGSKRPGLLRLNADGSLDPGFVAGLPGSGSLGCMALQPDGRIVVGGGFTSFAGHTTSRIARLNSNGSIDASFTANGINNTVSRAVVQPDGRIMISGGFTTVQGVARNRVARLLSDGTLDPSFDPGSGANNVVFDMHVQFDGKVLLVGNFTSYNGTPRNRVVRLNADGSLDTTFDPGAGANFSITGAVSTDAGMVMIWGAFTTFNGIARNALARLNPDGSLDQTFNASVVGSVITAVLPCADGRMLIAGSTIFGAGGTTLYGFGRLLPDGSIDPSFEVGMGIDLGASSMALAATGQVLVAGGFHSYNGSGRNRIARIHNGLGPLVTVRPRVLLDGPLNTTTNIMGDQLRVLQLLPSAEPYTAMGYTHVAGGGGETASPAAIAPGGNNNVVDWVLVELRDPLEPATILATRSALLQRDGDVVGTNGVSPVSFPLPAGSYHVAIRHCDHLGVMTASPIALSATVTTIDFTSSTTATWGTDARKNNNGTMTLWPGDANFDGVVRYTGQNNDRDVVLQVVGGVTPTNTVTGYFGSDVNMNGVVSYTGANNDRDLILQTIGGVVPTAVRVQQLP
ncbi:MAG TPA: delta-60 repeat domain-containing protein [Flavobacteriales bacterium]|nr:delta-60 repeat domain-containing protein [Flavobacteriales bacterium]